VVYGLGSAAVFLTFACMYVHVWRKRDQLALDDMERLRTRHILFNHVASMITGLTSVLLALFLPERHIDLAGYFYLVLALYFAFASHTFRRRERRISEAVTAAAAN
jgi:uncharacterized membrane protein YfcA